MKREQWSSNFGFLLAAAGSAVGLGNLWKFPYVTGSNGGAVFLVAYLLLLVLLGAPLLLTEMAVGRHAQKNAIDACRMLHPKWGFVGVAGVLGALIILSYYSVIGGWVTKYLFDYLLGREIGDADAYYTAFVSSTIPPIVWLFLFVAICMGIVICGVSHGIERISKIFLPLLILALVIIAGYALTLPNAMQGVRFLLLPNLSHIKNAGDVGTIIVRAMGQVFFSLSIGMGTLITYGSYLNKQTNLQKNAVLIPLFDLLVALLAGIAILPCVFSFGLEPTAGTGLLFQSLPYVFSHMALGRFFGILFFALVLFAAVTSAISLLESIVAYLMDHLHHARPAATILVCIAVAVLGIFNAMSFGLLADATLFGMTIFDWMVFLSDNVLMPIGGFFLCILVGYLWGIPSMLTEVASGGLYKIRFPWLIRFVLRFLAPCMIAVIFAVSLFSFFRGG